MLPTSVYQLFGISSIKYTKPILTLIELIIPVRRLTAIVTFKLEVNIIMVYKTAPATMP